QLAWRSFSTVNNSTRQPMPLHVRINSCPFSYELMHRMVKGRSLGMRTSGTEVIRARIIQRPGERDTEIAGRGVRAAPRQPRCAARPQFARSADRAPAASLF